MPAVLRRFEVHRSAIVVRHNHLLRLGDSVEPLSILVRDCHISGSQIIEEMVHRPWANDRAGDAGLIHAPRQRQLRYGTTLLLCNFFKLLQHIEGKIA